MKKMIKTLTGLLAAMLLVAAALPSAFATGFTYEPVEGTSTTFHKYLVLDSEANVPNATFQFTAAPGTAVAATQNSVAVLAGIGTPTIADVTFTPDDDTTDGQPSDTNGTVTQGKKYATQTVTVNFSGIEFTEPGIYRYIVTETETETGNQGVTNDTSETRTLDVYVVDKEDTAHTLEVSTYLLHTDTNAPAIGANNGTAGTALGDKSSGYTNTYDTSNLTISKQVSGNQASRDKYFKFTVTISKAVAGTVYTVDLSNADVTSGNNAATVAANAGKTNVSELTVGSDGTVTQIFYLQHGQSITIQGLAKGTVYAVTEEAEDYKSESTNASGTIASDDVTAAFTNTRNGVIPTGVLLTVAPFAAIMVVGAVGILVMVGKKRKRAE